MFVFSLVDKPFSFHKLTESNFIAKTQRKEPYYQDIGGEIKHYACCPACNNPIQIINLHVDKNFKDESQRKVKTHARHVKHSVKDIGVYNQAAYDECPYANPSSSISKSKRKKGGISDNILAMVENFPDIIDIVIKNDVGISLPGKLFKNMLKTFYAEEGHLYKYMNKFNVPYAFVYMANNQNLMLSKLDTYHEAGKEVIKAICENSEFCSVSSKGSLYKKKGVQGYVDISFYFNNFETEEIDGEKYQHFTFIIAECLNNGDTKELFQKKITFDMYYYYKLINKRLRYLKMTNKIPF